MRLNDVFTEELTEAPAGVFKQLSTAARAINPFSMSGQARAQGERNTQKMANQMYADYHKWAGERGEPLDTQKTVQDFLKQQGYNSQVIASALNKLVAGPRTAAGAPGGVDKKSMDQAFLAAAQTAVQPLKAKRTRAPASSATATPSSSASPSMPSPSAPSPSASAPSTSPSPAPSPSTTTPPVASPTPPVASPSTPPSSSSALTKNDVVQYYMTLGAADRQALIQELEMIPLSTPTSTPAVGTAPKKTSKPKLSPTKSLELKAKQAWEQQHPGVPYPGVKTVKPSRNKTEGYSKFLGREL